MLIVEDREVGAHQGGVADFLEFGIIIRLKHLMDEALAKFEEQDVSFVILGIQTPYINGLEVLKLENKAKLPVLMLTAFSDERV